MIAPQTSVLEIIGPYEGQHISGTSKNVVEVRLLRLYRFNDLEIEVRGIPARLDQETGGFSFAARDMKRLDRMVMEAKEAFKQGRQQASLPSLRHMPFKVQLELSRAA